LVSGLGEAVFDRALADADWLRERLDEAERGQPRRAKAWGQAALERADLHLRWTQTTDRAMAIALELRVISALRDSELWNRGPRTPWIGGAL
jgi:hypothetical protein